MTREEAILILQELWRYEHVKYKDYEVRTALEIAVKALDKQTCEDAISRQAAIDAIWNGINMDIYTREVKEVLEGLPPVTTKM